MCAYALCMCSSAFICVCIPSLCRYVCSCVCKCCALCGAQRTNLGVIFPQMPSTLFSETQFLTGTWSFLRNPSVSLSLV